MIIRCSARQIGETYQAFAIPAGRRCLRVPKSPIGRACRFSSSASLNGQNTHGPLTAFGPLVNGLDRIAPRFEIDAGDIEIIREPADFYATLKRKILYAKRRVFLSTLYIGKTEHELVRLNAALKPAFSSPRYRTVTKQILHTGCAR